MAPDVKAIDFMYYVATPEFIAKWNDAKKGELMRRARWLGRPGARTTAFVRVLLPLAAPGIVASAVFAFTLSWNEFLYALVFIQDERSITVPVGLNLLIYGDVFHWGELMAASVVTTLPVVGLSMFIHRWMVEGLASGSVKG
jgi:ABC-type glycerol-3-phosphate transport system permease component